MSAQGIKDIDGLSQEDWATMDDWMLEELLQHVTGQMAMAQARIRVHSGSYYEYLQAKTDYANYNGIGKMLQSLIRSKKG